MQANGCATPLPYQEVYKDPKDQESIVSTVWDVKLKAFFNNLHC